MRTPPPPKHCILLTAYNSNAIGAHKETRTLTFTIMMKNNATTTTILLVFLGTLCLRTSAFARVPKPFLYITRSIKLHEQVSPNEAAGDDGSLFDAEEAAAIDAHDLSDPGMEAAAMERAVMLAAEYKEEQLKKQLEDRIISKPCNGGAALIKSIDEQYKEAGKSIVATDEESLLDDEEAAAIDAHDVPDAGMEAAAMERAVMLAAEYKDEQQKKTDYIKAVEEHYKEVERDISAIERLIKEADDADHASVRKTMFLFSV